MHDSTRDLESSGAVSAACAAYDEFADFYAAYWGAALRDHALRAFDELLVPRLDRSHRDEPPARHGASAGRLISPGLRLIDLCCGTGELAAVLAERGHDVLGIDGSPRMLERASVTAPGAQFRLADARTFEVERPVEAVLCMYDSLNHLGSLVELREVFARVHAALEPRGIFLFDLNMRDGFETRFQGSFGFAEADRALLVCASFDDFSGFGRYELTLFRRGAGSEIVSGPRWVRTDATLEQCCFEEDDVRAALADADFEAVSVFDAEAALGMEGHIGRAMFVARRSG